MHVMKYERLTCFAFFNLHKTLLRYEQKERGICREHYILALLMAPATVPWLEDLNEVDTSTRKTSGSVWCGEMLYIIEGMVLSNTVLCYLVARKLVLY